MRSVGIIRFSLVAVVAALAAAIPFSRATSEGVDYKGELVTAGARATVRLITRDQYVNAIADIFGTDIKVTPRFPAMQRREGLKALGASTAVITPGAFELFEASARSISAQVFDAGHRDIFARCKSPPGPKFDEACARKFIVEIGRLIYRRPVTTAEEQLEIRVAEESTRGLGDFYAGLASSLAGMLASPKFLYVTEMSEMQPDVRGQYRLTAYSLASRLSLFLWNAPPDGQLLKAAETGDLNTRRGVSREVERMLASPRLEAGIRSFFADMLFLDDLDILAKDSVIYPAFTAQVAVDAKEQTLRTIVDLLVTRNSDYRDLLTTRQTFMNGTLGPLYQTAAPQPELWMPYDFPADSHRAGLLTEVSFLSLNAHPGRSSATRRGRALREHLLCQKVPDPPPNVDFSIIEDPHHQFKTARERLEAHRSDPTCAGCHKLTDPAGLGLENFDGAGVYRSQEMGSSIDASGLQNGKKFVDAIGLGEVTRDNPALTGCLTSRLYSYSIGRVVAQEDGSAIESFEKTFADHGYRVLDLMRAIAESEAFYTLGSHGTAAQTTASN